MSSSLVTRDEFHAWCQEVADKINADLEAMTSEERKEAIAGINEYARVLGGFPKEESHD